MKLYKNIFALLLFMFTFANSSFSQSVGKKIQLAVKEGEQLWNATSPDKSFMSEGNTMDYGLGYLKAGNYTSASWSFDELLKKNKDNAFANFFMGCVRMGLNDNAGAQIFFDKAIASNSSLKSSVPYLTLTQNKPLTTNDEQLQNRNITGSNSNQNSTAPSSGKEPVFYHYKVGDKVEISHAGGWWPGVVTKVEGVDKSVYVSVDYVFQNTKGSGSYAYNGVRPYTGQTTKYVAASKPGGALVYGDYVLTMGLGASQVRKGYFTLNANGTYTYNGVKGNYTYNKNTGAINWMSGTFKNGGKNTSSFTRGIKVAQIDITYDTPNGPLYYTAGHNLD